jgi:hypothetical protein
MPIASRPIRAAKTCVRETDPSAQYDHRRGQ